MTNNDPKIAIVGGSLAGLSAGLALTQNDITPLILEKRKQIGKLLTT